MAKTIKMNDAKRTATNKEQFRPTDNHKRLCISCRKSFKTNPRRFIQGSCGCSNPIIIDIGYRLRVPKHDCSEYQWKKFLTHMKETHHGVWIDYLEGMPHTSKNP